MIRKLQKLQLKLRQNNLFNTVFKKTVNLAVFFMNYIY